MGFFPTAWTRQPPGPQRIAAKWRSRVISAWYANARCDVVRGNTLTLTGGPVIRGDVLLCNGSGYASLGSLPISLGFTFSALCIATPGASLTARRSLFDTASDGNANHRISVNCGYTTASSVFAYNGTAYVAETGANYFATNTRAIYGYSEQAYAGGTPANFGSFYKNGKLWASGNATSSNYIGPEASYPLCVGGRVSASNNTLPWSGTIETLCLFQTVLSAGEFRELTGPNVWASLFEPLWVRRYFFGGIPAASGTITAAFSGAGTLAATGAKTAAANAGFTGASSLAAFGKELAKSASALSGSGSFAVTGKTLAAGVAVFSGTGSFAVTGKLLASGVVSFAGSGVFSALAAELANGVASFAGSGAISIVGSEYATGATSFSGTGLFVPAAHANAAAAAALSGSGSVDFEGATTAGGQVVANFSGSGAFAPAASELADAAGLFSGTGSLSGVGAALAKAAAAFSGTGSLAAAGVEAAAAYAALAGSGTLSGVTESTTAQPQADFAGFGAFSPVGSEIAAGAVAFAGYGTFTIPGPRMVTGGSGENSKHLRVVINDRQDIEDMAELLYLYLKRAA
jgi:hypothetical protein